ncbi:MAG: hypothetical protein HY000_21810 [Planctomycetes bacterium]|nr:hypothetical protein [Planctomycetota bacterium]
MKPISFLARGVQPFFLACVLLGAAAVLLAPGMAGADGNENPGVLPIGSTPYGMTYGEWGAAWWKAAFSIPVVDGDHPLLSGGAFGGENRRVLFLAGVFGEETTVIELTIPAGTALFFPIINAECSVIEPDPFHGDDEEELRVCANGHIDNTSGHFAEIDGVPVNNLLAYRVESPLFEFGPLPEDNLLAFFGVDAPAGATSLAVDAGVYLFVAPLSVGEHVIHFGATFDEFGASINTTYIITVE